TRRRARAPRGSGGGGGGGRAHADRVATRQRDELEAVAVVEVTRQDSASRVERRRAIGKQDDAGSDTGPIDDPDADAAVDGGRVLRGQAVRRSGGQEDGHNSNYQCTVGGDARDHCCRPGGAKKNRTNSTSDFHPAGSAPNALNRPASSTAPS